MKYPLTISTILSAVFQTPQATALSIPTAAAGGPDSPIIVTAQNYTDAEGTLLQGFLSLPPTLDEDDAATKAVLPAVIILHDASGPDTYEQQRATILAHNNGYVGFVADIYGFYAEPPPPDAPWAERGAFTQQFTNNATLFSMRIQAAIDYVMGMDVVDENHVGIIGYCLGGTGVVHYLNTRGEAQHVVAGDDEDNDFDEKKEKKKFPLIAAAVGVHPSLTTGLPGPVGNIEIPSLFLTGGDDFLTSPDSMAKLEMDMKAGKSENDDENDDMFGAHPWETVRYAKIKHAFSNWYSEGNYDERVDARSWHSAMTFFTEFGPDHDGILAPPPSVEMEFERVDYVDDMDGDYPLNGYIVSRITDNDVSEGELRPAVIILPHQMDNIGPDVVALRSFLQSVGPGHVGFVPDMFFHDMNINGMMASELEDMYHSNTTKYVSRIRATVDYVKTAVNGVDPDSIAVIGIGFGGSGALYYAMSGEEVDGAVKAIVSFHGEMDRVVNATVDTAAANAVPSEGSPWGNGGESSGGSTWGNGGESSGGSTWGNDSGSDSSSWGNGGDSTGGSSWGTDSGGDSSSWGNGGDSPGGSSWGTGSVGDTSSWGGADDSTTAWNNETMTRRTSTVSARPQILIQSGADGDAMQDVIRLEKALISMGANYELTRFSDAKDKFSVWGDENYNARATARSMDQVNTVLMEVFGMIPAESTDSPGDMIDSGLPVTVSPTQETSDNVALETSEPTKKPTKSPVAALDEFMTAEPSASSAETFFVTRVTMFVVAALSICLVQF